MYDVCSLIQGGASTVPISAVMSLSLTNALQRDRTKELKRAQVASPKQAESFLEGNPLFWMALKLQTLENAPLSVGLVFQLWGSTTKISWLKADFGTPAGTRYSWAIWSMVSSRPETGKMLRSGSFARPTTETFAGAICLHSRWFGDQKQLTCLAFSPWAPWEVWRNSKPQTENEKRIQKIPSLNSHGYIGYAGYDGSKFSWVAQNGGCKKSLVSFLHFPIQELCHFSVHCRWVSRGSPWICRRWSWWPDWCFAKATERKYKCPNHQRTCRSTHQFLEKNTSWILATKQLWPLIQ